MAEFTISVVWSSEESLKSISKKSKLDIRLVFCSNNLYYWGGANYVLKKLNLLPPRKKQAPWAYNEVLEDIETSIKYEGYIKRHEVEIKKLIKNEKITIGKDIDYSGFKGLSNEAKEKLNIVKPETFGQASRVSGVTPADLSALMIYLLPKK